MRGEANRKQWCENVKDIKGEGVSEVQQDLEREKRPLSAYSGFSKYSVRFAHFIKSKT